jgi:hypothetical protein
MSEDPPSLIHLTCSAREEDIPLYQRIAWQRFARAYVAALRKVAAAGLPE